MTDECPLEFNIKQNDASGNRPRCEFSEGQGMNGIDSKVRGAIERLNLTYIARWTGATWQADLRLSTCRVSHLMPGRWPLP